MNGDRVSFDESDPQRLAVEGEDAMNQCVERLFLACKSTIAVRACRLDYDFYFSETFTETCQSIVARDLRNQLQFLVEDEKYVMQLNSRLVKLARELSSYIKVHAIPAEYIERQEMFIVCDGIAYLHQPNIERPRGFMSTSDRGTAHRFSRQFKDIWERSAPPAELFTAGL